METKKITLIAVKLEHFRHLNRTFEFQGRDSILSGPNGSGKSSVYDAFLWVFENKDSRGRSEFSYRPDAEATVTVDVTVDVNGTKYVFTRGESPTYGKGKERVKGYTSQYAIDGLAMKQKEFRAQADRLLCTSDQFRLLTDLTYFMEQLPKPTRRQTLCDMAGTALAKPDGFEDLFTAAGKFTIQQYEKKLADEKKAAEKEREQIAPRIDELLRRWDGVEFGDTEKLEAKKAELEEAHTKLVMERQNVRSFQDADAEARKKVRDLKDQLADRNRECLHDVTGLKDETDRRKELRARREAIIKEIGESQDKVAGVARAYDIAVGKHATAMRVLEEARATLNQVPQSLSEDKTTCPTCKQGMPEGMVAELQKGLDQKRQKATIAATAAKDAAALAQKVKTEAAKEVEVANDKHEALTTNLDPESAKIEAELAEIDEKIRKWEGIDPETDEKCNELRSQIEEAAKAVAETDYASKIADFDTRIRQIDERISAINKSLENKINYDKDQERITELKAREVELSDQINNKDKTLKRIETYCRREAVVLADAVNGLFEHIYFVLFKVNLNGRIEPACEAYLRSNDRAYLGMSTGERIMCGSDIARAMSQWLGIEAPLFVDHSESLSLPVLWDGQIIRLKKVGEPEDPEPLPLSLSVGLDE